MGIGSVFRHLGSRAKSAVLRKRIRRLSKKDWQAWHDHVFELHPEYRRPAPRELERAHLAMWRPLRPDMSLNTIRACYNMSGVTDPEIVPEEVYTSEIQAALNRYDMIRLLGNKNVLNRWLPEGLPPEAHLHNIDGQFFDGDYRPVMPADVDALLEAIEYPVVIKPTMSGGGRDVYFPADPDELRTRMAGKKNYIVQRKIRQHPFFSRYYDYALNTIRACVYKSVRDGRIHFLNAAWRIGKGGSLDNLTAGGMVRFINEDGRLNGYALDNWGERFERHPDSGLDFPSDERIPKFDELREFAKRLAGQIFLSRLVSFDFCMDENGRWRVVELNLGNQTIQMAQYAGRPFFKPFTREVIDYCLAHPRWTVMLPP